MQDNQSSTMVSLYVVKNTVGQYFAGFDPSKARAHHVDDPRYAKKFTNKFDIKLRPDEAIVELKIDLARVEFTVSEPFRPHRNSQRK